tara:strand:+ start:3931 stop:5448 length:1518 start_codon:yes stop_codon:yes gene_type:complete
MHGTFMAANLYATNQAMAVLKYDIDLAAEIANSGQKVEKFVPLIIPAISIAMAMEGARIGVGGEGSVYSAMGKSMGKGIGMLGDVVGIDPLGWSDIEAGEAWKDLGTFSGDAVYNEPLMGGMLGSHTIEDATFMEKVGAGLVGAMQGLGLGGLRGAGKVIREGGEEAAKRSLQREIAGSTQMMRNFLNYRGRGLSPLPQKGDTLITTTGPKISRINPFSRRAEVTSQAKKFSPAGTRSTEVKEALDLIESGRFKTYDEAQEAIRALTSSGMNRQLSAHGAQRLSRFNPNVGSSRRAFGETLENAKRLDLMRRGLLGTTQYFNQTGGFFPDEGDDTGITGPPMLTDFSGAGGDLAQHTGYTSIGGGGFDGGMGGQFSGVGNQGNMGNIATQSSLRTGDKPIWAGQEWGGKYGTPVATGENMKIGERMLKEAKDNMYKEACSECGKNCVSKAHCTTLKAELKKEKMNEKSGSKKPAHGMVIVIGTKAGPGPSKEGKRQKLDSEKKKD